MSERPLRERGEDFKQRGYREFLEKPATKLLISMIPATENKEVLQTLLTECWNGGFVVGAGFVALSMAESMFRDATKDKGPDG